jgi:GNAT superfamily N-acetyltransferase
MPDATDFARQWAGIVALARLLGSPAIEIQGMVASVVPTAHGSSIANAALSVDPGRPPRALQQLATEFQHAGATKWGLWVDGDDARSADTARRHGMVLDSRPAPMVADLDGLAFDEAPERQAPDLATVGRVNDLAYGYRVPKLAPAIAALPTTLQTYGSPKNDSVAIAQDIGTDTAVWFVATLPLAQRKGLSRRTLQRLLLDARERGQRTASLQASQAGRPLYERLGFATVGTLHFYEQRFAGAT